MLFASACGNVAWLVVVGQRERSGRWRRRRPLIPALIPSVPLLPRPRRADAPDREAGHDSVRTAAEIYSKQQMPHASPCCRVGTMPPIAARRHGDREGVQHSLREKEADHALATLTRTSRPPPGLPRRGRGRERPDDPATRARVCPLERVLAEQRQHPVLRILDDRERYDVSL